MAGKLDWSAISDLPCTVNFCIIDIIYSSVRIMKSIILLFLLLCLSIFSRAQTISKLIITDNLSSSSKFGYGKPKPAAPKDQFVMVEEKGTQVLFYAEMLPSDELSDIYKLLFTAYRLNSGTNEWVDERLLEVKKTSTYALTAINFFNEGQYKIVVSTNENKDHILAEGNFHINKN